MGLQKVQAGGDARRLDLLQHLFQVGNAVGIFLPEIIIAAQGVAVLFFHHAGIVQQHHGEAALFGVSDVLVNVFRRGVGGPVGGGVDGFAAAALHAPGQVVVPLHVGNGVQQFFGGRDDQRCSAVFQLDAPHSVGGHHAVSLAVLGVNAGIGGGGQHIHRHGIVKGNIQPFAEGASVRHRQLQQAEFRHRGHIHAQVAKILRMDDKIHQGKSKIAAAVIYLHHGFKGDQFKAHNELAVLPAEAVGGKGGALIGVGQLQFVVEGALFRYGTQGHGFAGGQAFGAGGLVQQAFGNAVFAQPQAYGIVVQDQRMIRHSYIHEVTVFRRVLPAL